jgi:putative membrane protein
MRLSLIFSLIVAILVAVFALQNTQPMEVNLLFVETQGSAALVLIVTFAIGVVVGLLSTLPGRIRKRRKMKQLEKERDAARRQAAESSSAAPADPQTPSETGPPPANGPDNGSGTQSERDAGSNGPNTGEPPASNPSASATS